MPQYVGGRPGHGHGPDLPLTAVCRLPQQEGPAADAGRHPIEAGGAEKNGEVPKALEP